MIWVDAALRDPPGTPAELLADLLRRLGALVAQSAAAVGPGAGVEVVGQEAQRPAGGLHQVRRDEVTRGCGPPAPGDVDFELAFVAPALDLGYPDPGMVRGKPLHELWDRCHTKYLR